MIEEKLVYLKFTETVKVVGVLDFYLNEDFVPFKGGRWAPRLGQIFLLRFYLKDGVVYMSRPYGEQRNPFVRVKVVERASNKHGHPLDAEMSIGFRDQPLPLESPCWPETKVELSVEGKPTVLTVKVYDDVLLFWWPLFSE
jgi:hypothetical protein